MDIVSAQAVGTASQPRSLFALSTRARCYIALSFLMLGLFLFRPNAFPMQLWDESRLANNALSAAQGSHWLAPFYAGQPDHWNTKPPLMIWAIALFMKLGFPSLIALRLPSFLAALGTVLVLVNAQLRLAGDELAANAVGFILLGSFLYTGPHVARTGDYDALLTFFVTVYAMCFWAACHARERTRLRALALWAVFLFLAVMTKSIAGAIALPGLLVFALVDENGRSLVRDPRLWVAGTLAMAGVIVYYASRELYDPGYLASMWATELGGRFGGVNEAHKAGASFYMAVLLQQFEPGCLLLPAVALTLRSGGKRRSLALLCIITSAVFMLVLTASKTKLFWYIAPVLPMLSMAAALGVSDLVKLIRASSSSLPRWLPSRVNILLVIFFGSFCGLCVYRNQVRSIESARTPGEAQLWYGRLYSGLSAGNRLLRVVVVDHGVENSAGLQDYNPLLRFYSDVAAQHGVTTVVIEPRTDFAPKQLVASCDPESVAWLKRTYRFSRSQSDTWCFSGVPATRQ